MITIDPSSGRATAIVVADIPPGAGERVIAMASPALDIFAKQPGFVSATLYLSKDRDRLITHLQWEREEDHWNCLRSPDFAGVAPPPQQAPAPEFRAQLFDLVVTTDGHSASRA